MSSPFGDLPVLPTEICKFHKKIYRTPQNDYFTNKIDSIKNIVSTHNDIKLCAPFINSAVFDQFDLSTNCTMDIIPTVMFKQPSTLLVLVF